MPTISDNSKIFEWPNENQLRGQTEETTFDFKIKGIATPEIGYKINKKSRKDKLIEAAQGDHFNSVAKITRIEII